MNPYLTFSAVIACGLYGIKNKLPLTQPALRTKGENLPKLQRLPKTLQEATARMAHEASLARKVLGDDFVDHYCGTRVRCSVPFSLRFR
jgi:glutamine synthetase